VQPRRTADLARRSPTTTLTPAGERLRDGSWLSRLRNAVNHKMRDTDVAFRVID
jgi:hypothetical protein